MARAAQGFGGIPDCGVLQGLEIERPAG
jgi:hypothetical protein